MRFTKMHGAGNDFIIINNLEEKLPLSVFPALAKKLCTAHMSIGADGLMAVVPPEKGGDFRMLFYNADGSLGEMCGNGARCICRYGYEHGLAGDTQRVETTAGLVTGWRISRQQYRIRLNDPSVLCSHRQLNMPDGKVLDVGYAELGEPGLPHVVLVMPDDEPLDKEKLRDLGRTLRYHPELEKGANVNFVRMVGQGEFEAITYERGVEDFTLACGTGCGSIASVLALRDLLPGGEAKISMPGGTLTVSLTREDLTVRDIYLTGPSCIVCEGEIFDEE